MSRTRMLQVERCIFRRPTSGKYVVRQEGLGSRTCGSLPEARKLRDERREGRKSSPEAVLWRVTVLTWSGERKELEYRGKSAANARVAALNRAEVKCVIEVTEKMGGNEA